MLYRIYILCIIFLSLQISCGENSDWGYENAPGIAMDYKVHIDAGKEDCYWQYVHPTATIYVSMKVLKGGDGMAGLAVRDPQGNVVHSYEWKPSSEYEEVSKTGGYYAICIDNQFSRFSAKLVNLYITTFRYDMWEKYTEELEKLDISVNNFTESIKNVDQRIHNMLQYQSHSRARESRDYKLLLDNFTYITYWSIAQCLAVIATSTIQVYYVRKSFDSKSSTTKSGARA